MEKSLIELIVLCLLVKDESQQLKLTPTLSCLKAVLQQINHHKINFYDGRCIQITSFDCKNVFIKSIRVSYFVPEPLKDGSSTRGCIAISVINSIDEYVMYDVEEDVQIDDYVQIDDRNEIYTEALDIFSNFINDED